MKDPSPHWQKNARINPEIDQGPPGAGGQDLRLMAMTLELFDAEKKFLPGYR